MTSEWHEVSLRELVGYMSKGIAPSYAEEASETTIRVLNQKCNRNFRISYGDSRLHDTLKKKVPPERYVKPDDILINSTGAGTAGRIAQIEDVPSATTIDGHMILIRSNGKVTQKFLGYALKAHQWEVLQLDEGSTGQTELNRDRLLDEIMINYPVSFDEQNAIVGTLESIDRKLVVNEQLNDNLEQQISALFINMFGFNIDNLVDNKFSLGDLVESVDNRGKTPPLSDKPTSYPIIDVKALSGDIRIVDYNNCTKYVDEETYNNWFRSGHPKQYDILISTVGSLAEMKIFLGDIGCIAQNVVGFRSKGVSPLYLYQYLNYIKSDLVAYNIGSVQPSIKVTHIIKHPIYVAPQDELDKFDSVARSITEKIFANCQENESLKLLRDTLLPKLMSGELDVSDIDL